MNKKISEGDLVWVTSLTDSTALPSFLNKVGMVIYIDGYGGVCNTMKDPLIGIELANGEVDSFWTEELTLIEPLQ